MVYLQASEKETAYVFCHDDDSDSIILDFKGVYALIDGASSQSTFLRNLRSPTSLTLSSLRPSWISHYLALNSGEDTLAIVANLPSTTALKPGEETNDLKQLLKNQSLIINAQLKTKLEPIVLYKHISQGALSLYTLVGDGKDVDHIAKAYSSQSREAIESAVSSSSSVYLFVWIPVREDSPIFRVLHFGSSSLLRVQQAVDRARSLPFLHSPSPTPLSLKTPKQPSKTPPVSSKPPSVPPSRAPPSRPAPRPVPATRTTAAPQPRPSDSRTSLAGRPIQPSTRPSTRPSAPPRGVREEVAKKTTLSKQKGASSSRSPRQGAPSSTPSRPPICPSATPSSPAAPPSLVPHPLVSPAAPPPTPSHPPVSPSAPPMPSSDGPGPIVRTTIEDAPLDTVPSTPPSNALSVSTGGDHSTPGGLPVPPSPTLIPATPQPPSPDHNDDAEAPVDNVEEPIAEPVRGPSPSPQPSPSIHPSPPTADLLGDFNGEPEPNEPEKEREGSLDVEEPMRLKKISMDTQRNEATNGLEGSEETVQAATEFEDVSVPEADMTRRLSQQAEERLLSNVADPFIAGLASTVVEEATVDGAKNALESLLTNAKGIDSPTGDKLMSFRSSGYENADDPKEVKYEETDPAIDAILSSLADESDQVNGTNGVHPTIQDKQRDGWPEGSTMSLPPPRMNGGTKEPKFKLSGSIFVDLVTVPHKGKQILLNDEASSLEFFSNVRSSGYILSSGGEVPPYVLEGLFKGKGSWGINVGCRVQPTHSNAGLDGWWREREAELSEVGLSLATPSSLVTNSLPDGGSVRACRFPLRE